MNTDRIHIARGELLLGIWTLEEVRQLLANGLLFSSDEFWMSGQEDWQPLSQLPAEKPNPVTPIVGRIGQALREAAGTVERTTKAVIGAASEKAAQQKQQVTDATERLLNGYLPRLIDPVQRALAATSHTVDSALRDEVFLRKLFGATYDLLPRPVCRFVSEPDFIEFCLKHRLRLLKQTAGETTADPSSPPPSES